MGTSSRDIFGNVEAPQPAVAGSFGEPPNHFRLPDATHPGRVRLQVADLDRSLLFYERVLGFRAIERTSTHAILGPHGDETPLVELMERRGARAAPHRGSLGLYHFAILVPDRATLGRFVRHLSEIDVAAGSADHLVSEAFYLQDPDNLGIEVYVDRPRDTWRRMGRQLMMATDPIDVAGLLSAAGNQPWSGLPAGTVIGHVHLHVGDVAKAAAFFSEGIGFDRTVWHYPGALFLSAGGYHHHLGANTWAGVGAVPPREHDARLIEWTLELPDAASVAAVEENLNKAGYQTSRDGDPAFGPAVVVHDPWGTPVRLQFTP